MGRSIPRNPTAATTIPEADDDLGDSTRVDYLEGTVERER